MITVIPINTNKIIVIVELSYLSLIIYYCLGNDGCWNIWSYKLFFEDCRGLVNFLKLFYLVVGGGPPFHNVVGGSFIYLVINLVFNGASD